MLSEMPDPSSQFSGYLSDHNVALSVPRIYNENGVIINPGHYKEMLPTETWLAVLEKLKLYDFYHLICDWS